MKEHEIRIPISAKTIGKDLLNLIEGVEKAEQSGPKDESAILKELLKKRTFQYMMLKLEYAARTIPERIIKSGPATIVFWADGTKTVVKCAEGTEPDDYTAFCAALAKKVYGSNSALKKAMLMAMNNNDMEGKPGASE